MLREGGGEESSQEAVWKEYTLCEKDSEKLTKYTLAPSRLIKSKKEFTKDMNVVPVKDIVLAS